MLEPGLLLVLVFVQHAMQGRGQLFRVPRRLLNV